MQRDLYAEVTHRIVSALEAGVTPWIHPWSAEFDPSPVNAVSRRNYRGINAVLLTLEAQTRGYSRSAWMTYFQANAAGGRIRQGESGTTVVFYKLHDLPHGVTPEQVEEARRPKVIPFLRRFTVFNLAQIDGLPDHLKAREAMVAWDPQQAAETLLAESRADIRHGGYAAFYSPREDRIQLPERGCFPDGSAYYATALHELTHWTGHPGRLNRNLGLRFGEAAYAMEELIAEMGSAFLCAGCHLQGRLRHADYIGEWLKVLRNDKRAVFAAAAKAQKAADFIESVCGRPHETAAASAEGQELEAGVA